MNHHDFPWIEYKLSEHVSLRSEAVSNWRVNLRSFMWLLGSQLIFEFLDESSIIEGHLSRNCFEHSSQSYI